MSESWIAPSFSELPADWNSSKRIGLDTETYDPRLKDIGPSIRHGGYVVGISFAFEDGPSFYLPVAHEGGGNMNAEKVWEYLRYQSSVFTGEIVGANLPYDLDYLAHRGVVFRKAKAFKDVQVADPLINENHFSYSLQNIALRHGLEGKDETILNQKAVSLGLNPKSEMWKLPAEFVGLYAEQDAALPLKILRKQEKLIDKYNLWDVWNLETSVLPVLVKMRRRGVRLDTNKLEYIENATLNTEAEALNEINRLTGVRIAVGEVWDASKLLPALIAAEISLDKTPTGKPSINKDLFTRDQHPVVQKIAEAREANKVRTTFCESIRNHMTEQGRIHTTFNQIARQTEAGDQKGARFGRLSSINPNMQQQPARGNFAKLFRSIFIPEEGKIWASCDYSQQEPRWTTHYAAAMGLPKAAEAAQAYHDDPKLDNHQFMADLTGLPRKQAKNLYLGICYGEGAGKLCEDLGIPILGWAARMDNGSGNGKWKVENFNTEAEARAANPGGMVWRIPDPEAKRILSVFNEKAPYISGISKIAQNRAVEKGYIITGGGRRLGFMNEAIVRGPAGEPKKIYAMMDDIQKIDEAGKLISIGERAFTYKALNKLIQGTAGDQGKKAVVEIDAAGHYLQLMVHDEVTASVRDVQEARDIASIMENCMTEINIGGVKSKVLVPFRVDVETGPSWGESMS